MANAKRTEGQNMILMTLSRKLNIEQHKPHWKLVVNPCALEGLTVPAPHVPLWYGAFK